MRLKKNITIGGLLILVICPAIIISVIIKGSYAGDYQKSIYNDNSKITAVANSYSYLNKVGTNENNKTDLEFRFTGMDTIWELEAEKDTDIKLSYNSNISGGKFKVVLITPQEQVIDIIDQASAGEKEIKLVSGKSRIKIVGDDARGNLKMELFGEEGVKIVPLNN